MARKVLTNLDGLKIAELQNFRMHNVASTPSSPGAGQVWYDTAVAQMRWSDGTFTRVMAGFHDPLSAFAAPTGPVNFATQRITSLGDPTSAQDAATKNYVDNAFNGLGQKLSARAATTANITLSGAQTIDGVSIVAGDRVLVKNQTNQTENGIYVAAAGAWARAADADSTLELGGGHHVFVREGTTQSDTGWLASHDQVSVTIGTTNITYVSIANGASVLGGAGLTKTGNTIDAVAAAGSGIVVNADNIDLDPVAGVPVNRGGTGAITAAGAKTNLGFVTRFAATIGDGSATSIAVTHNLGTRDVIVSVHDAATFDDVDCDVVRTSTSVVTLGFAAAPASNALRVTVIG